MRAKRARRAAAQNFEDTLDTLVPLTARHWNTDCILILQYEQYNGKMEQPYSTYELPHWNVTHGNWLSS